MPYAAYLTRLVVPTTYYPHNYCRFVISFYSAASHLTFWNNAIRMASKGNTKKLTLKTQTSSAPDLTDSPLKSPKRKISPNQLLPTPSPTTAVNGLNASPNSDLPPPRTPTTPTSVNSATISDSDSVSLAGERRLVRRSSVICSSGKDKYTFDSEHAHNPSRTVNFRLEERHTRHLGPSMKNATSVFKETIPQTIPSPAPESSEATIKRHSVVHPGQADLPKSVCINGRFQNPWPTWRPPSFTNILKFGFSKDKSNIPSKQDLDLLLPIIEPNFPKFVKDGIRVTWLGHATVLVQMHGMNILTDPIFSERASPSQVVGPKRYRDVPCSVHDLPPIHAVVISHSHYDHLDLNSVTLLNARFGSDLRWFVPLGLTDWMNQAGCENVMALDWWEENCVPDFSDVSFVFTASQHWCKRTIGDDNKVLWGGWAVLGPRYRFYYPGDTGYCDVFKQIGHTYGPFDVSAIPIGAYEPRWFMKYQHVDPLEAVKIHEDVKSKFSIGIHWGTFALANEFYLDPPLKLRAALQERQLPENCFITLKHGESKQIGGDDTPQDEPTRKTSNSRPSK